MFLDQTENFGNDKTFRTIEMVQNIIQVFKDKIDKLSSLTTITNFVRTFYNPMKKTLLVEQQIQYLNGFNARI